MAAERKFTSGGALRTVFDTVGKKVPVLAKFYIDRDPSLVYKWLRDEAVPPDKLLPEIVRFVLSHTDPVKHKTKRVKLKSEMDAYIRSSTLCEEIQTILTGQEDFEKYIKDVLDIAVAESRKKLPEDPPRLVLSLMTVALALLAALSGGFVWNILNHLFGWRFYMGGSGNEPAGVIAFLWGLTAGAPIIAFALLSIKMAKPSIAARSGYDWRFAVALYSLAAGAAGFIFYNSGFRSWIEGLGYAHGLQETVIVIAYAMLLSFLPMLSILTLLHFPKTQGVLLAAILTAPVLVSVLSVWGTVLINRPEAEVAQLRGFVVGLTLRLAMFAAVRTVLTGSPKEFRVKYFVRIKSKIEVE